MRVNFFGSVYCTHYALPHLERSGGRLAAVCSLAGLTGVPTRTAYAASKHAMSGFFNSLRIELAGDGVSVTIAYPGFVATEIAARAIGPHGVTLGQRPVRDSAVMPADECARRILSAVADRRREVVMTLEREARTLAQAHCSRRDRPHSCTDGRARLLIGDIFSAITRGARTCAAVAIA